MADFTVRDVFIKGWKNFSSSRHLPLIHLKAANAVMNCKTPAMGFNAAICDDCSYLRIHYCSCGNCNCPQC